MPQLLSHLKFLAPLKKKIRTFFDEHGKWVYDPRSWEDAYRTRWQYDKIVRSTHGVNCTGSCSWKIYVKGGIVTWETQQTDYPRTRPDLPNHEPRGCPRGASYSWYLYSGHRLKYPMVRGVLLKQWREARLVTLSAVDAWTSLVKSPEKRKAWQQQRGLGGFVRASWDEVNEIIAAANIYTIKQYGPDRIAGFSPIPAMSMVSYAAGTRYLSLLGGVCLSFYDWYCDLPPSSPQVWGEQTDVPESADWFNATYLIAWGSNVPQTRTPDAHFFTEARYRGTRTVAVTPDYAEVSKLVDIWLHPKQGTDAAMAMAMGHVILKEFYIDERSAYFDDYVRRYTDMPCLVVLAEKILSDGTVTLVPDRYMRASDLGETPVEDKQADWKTVAYDQSGACIVHTGSIGFRWDSDHAGQWNLASSSKDSSGKDIRLKLSLMEDPGNYEVASVGFPYFGGVKTPHFPSNEQDTVLLRRIPLKTVKVGQGKQEKTLKVATVFDLLIAHYGVDRGLGGQCVQSYQDNLPYTPMWQSAITGVNSEQVIAVARQFAKNADQTLGKSMVIIGAGMNHWYHNDMNYRSIINLLMMCGCIGKSGGGWAHYVGQEKLRPQTGWTPLAFAFDWIRPTRWQNSTSYFYAHSDQWRYEKLEANSILSPLADKAKFHGSMIDYNVRAERMGWLPSAPQLQANPIHITKAAQSAGLPAKEYVVQALQAGQLKMSCEDPDHPLNWPRNFFIWRSNLLGSSAKGHEYFLKHLLGTHHGVQGKALGDEDAKPEELEWHAKGPEGKLDLLVTIDFRMSTTCLYSDIVLPTATWYEKNDLNTSDMHPFIHPLSSAVDPVWESRSDWEIYKGLAKKFSLLCKGHLALEEDVMLTPLMHDTPCELGQALGVSEWRKGGCALIPGKTAPNIVVAIRDYPNTYKRFTALGPLMESVGNGGKGITWDTKQEVTDLKALNGTVEENGATDGMAKIESDIDAAETILMLAPETNGAVAVKAWDALSNITGRTHRHLALHRADEKIRFRDIQAQPKKIISSPTWSGIESEHVSYSAGYTNVHEYIPWRTLTGRQQFYQDHPWMIAFGESFATYRPPVDLKAINKLTHYPSNGHKEMVLNFLTPHQKWGIHSTFADNLIMLTLGRGGPVVWLSEKDAKEVDIADNDWVELYNDNGAVVARAIVSQRINRGVAMMYHAQEKNINVPKSEITGLRAGIHNSVTRIVLKPTHMIGGYAQHSYGFNYYGTIGTHRDEFVVLRKLSEVNWLDDADDPNFGKVDDL